MKKKLVFLLVLVACVVAAWYLFDLGRYLSFYYIQSKQAEWQLALEQHPLWVALAFFDTRCSDPAGSYQNSPAL